MVKKILLTVVALIVVAVVAVVGLAATRPDQFKVERSVSMAVPPEAAYAQVVDFHAWERWSPWAKLDPTMKATYSGAPSGVGASYHWVGDDKVGEGRMTITEVAPPSRVAIRLEFLKPFAATNDTAFAFAPEGAGTRVTWTMSGKNEFLGKVMSLFVNMDQMIGRDFEKGLAQLAAASATGAPAQ